MQLTQRQREYGFDYYFKDDWNKIDAATTVSQYDGQDQLIINCTQLSEQTDPAFASGTAKKRVLQEWCGFLCGHPKAFKQLAFGTRMPQELFDAVCSQVNLIKLEINWGGYRDLSKISNLQKLQLLRIGSGAAVQSIAPLTELRRLVGLSIENFQKITDYSPLIALGKLQSLTIEGDGLGPQYIHVDNLRFLEDMTQLRFLTLLTVRLKQKDYYRPILKLRKLEHLTLGSQREVKAIYDELMQLPKLKWGLLKVNPKLYGK